MSARRVLLVGMLIALGFCALAGVLTLGLNSDDEIMWQILWGAIVTALACGLLLPLTLLTDRPKLRLCGFVSMGLIALLWLITLAFIAVQSRWAFDYYWEDAVEMSLAFTLLIGIPTALVSLLVSFRWARVAVFSFLGVAGLSWLLCEAGAATRILLPYPYEYLLATGMTLYGLGACACELLINYRCGDRRHFRWIGIAAAALAAALFIVVIWSEPFLLDPHQNESIRNVARVACELLIAAIVMGHINLLLMARLRQSQVLLQWLTIGAALLGGAVAAPIPFLDFGYNPYVEPLTRATVALGIATGSGSVALIVLSMLNRKPAAQLVPGALTATDITLICPRCQTRQTLALGDSACKNCELQFTIKLTEPRCPACGYLLYQLTSAKCPECGALVRETPAPPPVSVPQPPAATET